MSDKNKYILYEEDMARPKIKDIGISVHKVVNQIENLGKDHDEVIDEYYMKEVLSEDTNNKNMDNISKDIVFDHDMINACIKYYKNNKKLIDEIIEEDAKLKDALFNQDTKYFDPEKAKSDAEELDLKYFNVSVNKIDSGKKYQFDW